MIICKGSNIQDLSWPSYMSWAGGTLTSMSYEKNKLWAVTSLSHLRIGQEPPLPSHPPPTLLLIHSFLHDAATISKTHLTQIILAGMTYSHLDSKS